MHASLALAHAPTTTQRRATLSYMAPALAALCLAACGGGGGGSVEAAASANASNMIPTAATTSSSPIGATVLTTADASSAQAASGRATVQATASLTAQPNTHYQVNAAGIIDIVLPTTHLLQVGDVVSVRGVSGNAWRLVPGWSATLSARARTYPFYISTAQLPGNSAPGQVWKPRLDRKAWQWVATEQEGSVMVAADAAGQLHVSSDAGETWTAGNSPTGNWVSVSMTRMTWANPSGAAGQVSIVAAAQGGGLYRSNGDGNWTAVSSSSGADLGSRNWAAVDISAGQVVTAAEYNGAIYSGTELAPATAVGGATLVRAWRGLSRGAGTMAAVNEEGEVHVSLDGGRTFELRNVNVGGAAVTAPWHKVAVSEDGKHIAVAGRTGSALYLSADAGLTWSRTAAPVGDYAAIALSGDGRSIGAALSGTAGGVQMSTNGGASFAALPMPGTDTDWRAFAMSEDGKQLVAAGRGANGVGQLVTSLGDRTAYASGKGAITAGASDAIDVEYMGNMRYQVRQSSKGPFSIR
jgi:hypothetical protein